MNFFSWRFGKKDVAACDADTPPISITPNNSGGHTLVNMPTGSGKAVAKGVSQQSLEEHDKRFHHGHYDGGSCKYREQNGIKTGAAGTGGTGTATPTTSPAPSSKPITIQEKAEIREEDTLSKNPEGTESKQPWQKKLPRSYQIPDRLQKKFYPWLNPDQSDKETGGSGAEKEDSQMENGNSNSPKDGGSSNTDPIGRPVDANGNLIEKDDENGMPHQFQSGGNVGVGRIGSQPNLSRRNGKIDGLELVDGNTKSEEDFSNRMRKILEESGMSQKQEMNDDGNLQKKNAWEDYLDEILKGGSLSVNDWRPVDRPVDPKNPPPDVTFVQTSFGGTEGYWRTKTEEEMREEIEEYGELKPWKRRFDYTGAPIPEYVDPFKPKIKPHVKDFMQKLKGQKGKTRQLVNAAKKSGMTPAEWIDGRMKKLGIKPKFGRLSKSDVQRILEEKDITEREFEPIDIANPVAGNVWWMPEDDQNE